MRSRQDYLIIYYCTRSPCVYLSIYTNQKVERKGVEELSLVQHKLQRSSLVDRSVNRLRSATKFALLMHFNRPWELSDDNHWKID